jgi:hypothetical protein
MSITNETKLSRLTRVDLRDIWLSESSGFTPWLAQPANLELLADTLDLELELEAQEKNVGPFRADILCKDTATGAWVLIENQLERTDHCHLGQLLTYAAGLDAVTIVWVSARFTEEHRAALDWLNKITEGSFNFFGLEVELWRIGDSPVAPKFNIVCKPNDWSQTIKRAAIAISDGELTGTQQLQLDYWTQLWAILETQYPQIRGTKPLAQNWNNFSIGRSSFGMHASVNTQQRWVRVGVSCFEPHSEAHFHLLKQQQSEIEKETGPLDWEALPGRKESRIAIRKLDFDPTNREDWPRQHQWIASQLCKFDNAFRQRIKNLDADDYTPEQNGQTDS